MPFGQRVSPPSPPEGRQGAEAAIVRRGTTFPLSLMKTIFPLIFWSPAYPNRLYAPLPPAHNTNKWRIPSLNDKHIRIPGSINRHTPSACMPPERTTRVSTAWDWYPFPLSTPCSLVPDYCGPLTGRMPAHSQLPYVWLAIFAAIDFL